MCVGGQRHALAALPLGKTLYQLQEAEWAPGPVWTGAENLASPHPGFDHRTVQPVASWYTDWAIEVHTESCTRYGNGKGKVLGKPLKNTGGVQGRLHSFLNSALEWMDRFTPQPLYQGERIAVTTGWTARPVRTLWRRYKYFAPTKIRTLDRPVRSLVTMLARQRNDACRTCC